jgi:uncharacterized protein (DUF3084 family)
MNEWTEDDRRAQEWAEREHGRRRRERRLADVERELGELERRVHEMERAATPIMETAARFGPVA